MLLQLLMITMGLTMTSISCSSSTEAPTSSKKKAEEDDDDDDDDDGDIDIGCSSNSSSDDDDDDDGDDDDDDDTDDTDDDGDDDDDSTSLALADAVWKGNVEDEFDKCISCHASGNEANDDNKDYDCSDPDSNLDPIAIDLSTIELIKENADEIVKRLEADDDCKMPPTGSGIDLELFEEWMDNDFAEASEDSSGDDDDDSGGSNPCGTSSTPSQDDDIPELFEPFLNPPKLKECHGSGKMYDRLKLACTDYALSATCDEAWLEENFPSGWEAINSDHKGNGYKLDQCGSNDTEFLATWYCMTDVSGGDCKDPSVLTKEKAVIKVEKAAVDK
jgi:hypothetical protein